MTADRDDIEARRQDLINERNRLAERMEGHSSDLVAILIVRPHLRDGLLATLAASDGLVDIVHRVLRWVDELMMPRDADDLRLSLELQAQVALATTRDGLADLDPGERR